MANEATLRERFSNPINMTCADGTGIEKGAVLKIADPRTASLSDGDADYVAGICAREKIANDGRTSVAVYRDGIFDMVVSGAVTCGQAVMTYSSTGAANVVAAATSAAIGSKTLGIALETGSEGETIQVELKPGCNNTAYS
jgi:hypothetical protein